MAVMTPFWASEVFFRWPNWSVQDRYNDRAEDRRPAMPTRCLERWVEPDLRLKTLVDGDAEDLSGGCCAEVRDVEVAVRAECHTGRNGEPGGYILDIAGAIKAYNLAIAGSWKARSGRELERIEKTIRPEVDGDHCGKAGTRSGEAKLLELVAAAETEEEWPGACASVEAHDLA